MEAETVSRTIEGVLGMVAVAFLTLLAAFVVVTAVRVARSYRREAV